MLIFCSALSEICLECSNFSQISDIEFRKISDNIQNKISKKFIYVSAKNLHEGGTKILYPQKYITFEINMYTANVLTITSRDGDGVILFISIIDINVGNCLFWAPTKNNLQSNELKIIILKDNKLNLS